MYKKLIILTSISLKVLAQSLPYNELSFALDKTQSAISGANFIHSSHKLFQHLDNLTPNLATSEQQSFYGYLWRYGKFILLDIPVTSLATIVQHEYFGHGARLRELDINPIRYKIQIFKGVTFFPASQYNQMPTIDKNIISLAGVEANLTLATHLRHNWLQKQQISNRQAILYLLSKYDQIHYILSTKATHNSQSNYNNDGHDINNWISGVNRYHANDIINANKLRQNVWINLLDPVFFYAIYAIGQQLIYNQSHTDIIGLQFKNFYYLPSAGTRLTPWGQEMVLVHDFIDKKQQWQVKWQWMYGNNNKYRSYCSDLLFLNTNKAAMWQWGINLAAWYQPNLYSSQSIIEAGSKLGGSITFMAKYEFADKWFINCETGYKTSGYLTNEILRKNYLWRISINMPISK